MKQFRLVVIIPAFNEESTIGPVISQIPRKIEGISSIKILVVNDGSTDNTFDIASKAGASRVINHQWNMGLGVAFQTGIKEALEEKADIVVNIDADLQFDAQDISKIVKPIVDQEADFVTCSRFLDKNFEPKLPFIKKFGNKIFTRLVNFLTNGNFTDTQCGFRAYSQEACLRLNIFGKHTYTQEVFLSLSEHGMRIREIVCKVKGQRSGKSKVVGNVFSYGLKALLIMIRFVRDYRPLAFFGGIGIAPLAFGVSIGAAVFLNWFFTGHTSPFTSLISVSGIIIILGFLIVMLALLADMNGRQRKTQEEILYRLKKNELLQG